MPFRLPGTFRSKQREKKRSLSGQKIGKSNYAANTCIKKIQIKPKKKRNPIVSAFKLIFGLRAVSCMQSITLWKKKGSLKVFCFHTISARQMGASNFPIKGSARRNRHENKSARDGTLEKPATNKSCLRAQIRRTQPTLEWDYGMVGESWLLVASKHL